MRLRTVKGTGAEARRVSVNFLLLESACFRRVDSCSTVICKQERKNTTFIYVVIITLLIIKPNKNILIKVILIINGFLDYLD